MKSFGMVREVSDLEMAKNFWLRLLENLKTRGGFKPRIRTGFTFGLCLEEEDIQKKHQKKEFLSLVLVEVISKRSALVQPSGAEPKVSRK